MNEDKNTPGYDAGQAAALYAKKYDDKFAEWQAKVAECAALDAKVAELRVVLMKVLAHEIRARGAVERAIAWLDSTVTNADDWAQWRVEAAALVRRAGPTVEAAKAALAHTSAPA